MIKITAAYNYCNPNFVIQNLDEPKSWSHPVFAILHNIFMRGCPTIPSRYLRENINFGDSYLFFDDPLNEHYKIFSYHVDCSNLDWSGIIKGGNYNNPAYEFYQKILTRKIRFGETFIPECPLNEIIEGASDNSFVDFYSPIYKTVIEIDGIQHYTSDNQRLKDTQRDSLLESNRIKVIRIPTEKLNSKNLVDTINNQLSNNSNTSLNTDIVDFYPLPNVYTNYSFAIRLQILLTYLYGNNILNFDSDNISICIKKDFNLDIEVVKTTINDFYLWLKNIAGLFDIPTQNPKINVDFVNDFSSIQNDAIKIDISLTKAYCSTKNTDIFYIRNNHFKQKNNFNVATANVNYNLNESKHYKFLEFILQNVAVKEYSEYRENQLNIIINALTKKAVIGLLPTGAGKSLCYQIASLLIPGATLVISPLNILMSDQRQHIVDKLGITNAYIINSDHIHNIKWFKKNKSLITYIAPERFFNSEFKESIKEIQPKFIVIDEAHCLSEWGHDFRTSYLCLSHNLKEYLQPKDTHLMALTGTAAPNVIKDIENEFETFKGTSIDIVYAFDMARDNLKIIVKSFNSIEEQYQALEKNLEPTLMDENDDKTIVFTKMVGKKMETSTIGSYCIPLYNQFKSNYLSYNRIDVFAGKNLSNPVTLSNFKNGNELKIIFATKAFGMGVDIPDIRKTIHYGIPSSLESLYQEMGRAGRDQLPSYCYVYYVKEDPYIYNYIFNNKDVSISKISHLYDQFRELKGNCFFIQSDNLDVENEVKALEELLRIIKFQNDSKIYYLSLEQICRSLVRSNYNLSRKFYNYKGYLITDSASNIVEKLLYRLFLLGEINIWTMLYEQGNNGPIYNNLKCTNLTEKQKLQRVKNYILKYQSRIDTIIDNTFVDRATTLVQWTFDNFILERVKAIRTLYEICQNYTNSDDFMEQISNYFSTDEPYQKLINDKNFSTNNIKKILKDEPKVTKDKIARALESFEKKDALNFVSGITRLRLNEFDNRDGETRLEYSLVGIRLLNNEKRERIFLTGYNALETISMKNIFTQKWLDFIEEDLEFICKETQNIVAKQKIIEKNITKLKQIRETLYEKFQQ